MARKYLDLVPEKFTKAAAQKTREELKMWSNDFLKAELKEASMLVERQKE